MRNACVVKTEFEISLFQRDHCQSYSGWIHKEEVLSTDMKPKKQKNKKLSSYPLDYAARAILTCWLKLWRRLYAELVKVQS